MENEEKQPQQIDIFILLDDFLRQAKRLLILGLVLVIVCSAGMAVRARRGYREVYEAYASFTVRVSNPLYASVSSYNERTAEVMADTFPSILTSSLLQRKVMEKLEIGSVPSLGIRATAQSSILTLTVRDGDPQRAYDVLNAVIECYPEVAEFVVGSTTLVLLDESGVPTVPTTSFSYKPHLLKGAMYGGAAWCAIVVAMILLKNTIHNEEELRKTLNIPCLGQIPTVKLTRKMPNPLIHKLRRNGGFSESVRLLRLRIEKAMEEEEKKILLVSSAIPGEGKTTVAANLSISLAQKGKKVLLIDCDLRNPSVVKVLSDKNYTIENKNHLVDFLKGNIKLKEAIQVTKIAGLSVIPGGPGGRADYATLMSQGRMAQLIENCRNHYDYVILDTPPCSLLADAAEVAELAECGLMVIRQDYAARDQILDGVQRLSDGKMIMIGCALNNVRKTMTGSYGYGYGYGGYGYGYGYGSYGKKK